MNKFRVFVVGIVLVLFCTGFKDCYKPVTNSGLPKHIKTIAVPAFQFESKGARFKVSSKFTDAVVREMIKRGRGVKVQSSRNGADAVVEGTIRSFRFSGVLLDGVGRARVYEVTITSAITIRDLKKNRIIYDNRNFIFRDSFEFSQDPRSFFNEEDPTVERIAKAFAESVISTVTNGIGVRKRKGT